MVTALRQAQGPSIRGAAAGIGRGVESTGVFGWVTGDRLRRVWLILIIKL